MIIIACIDDKGGMLFNHRRQSQDRVLRENLLASGGPVWMNGYSAKQFSDHPEAVRVAEDFPDRAGAGELCFFEDTDPAPYLDKAEEIVLYKWNRHYPSDRWFPLPLEGWRLVRSEEFPGSSHELITKEVYQR